MTAPVLNGIAVAALGMLARQDDHYGIQLLENLPTVPRFDMIVMSLPRRDKAVLKDRFDAAQGSDVLDSVVSTRLQKARSRYRV